MLACRLPAVAELADVGASAQNVVRALFKEGFLYSHVFLHSTGTKYGSGGDSKDLLTTLLNKGEKKHEKAVRKTSLPSKDEIDDLCGAAQKLKLGREVRCDSLKDTESLHFSYRNVTVAHSVARAMRAAVAVKMAISLSESPGQYGAYTLWRSISR